MAAREKVVVTGGAGFIGSHLTDALAAAGYHVVVVDNMESGRRSNISCAADIVKCDVRDVGITQEVFRNAICVFHLAAKPRVQFSIMHPWTTHGVNVDGTVAVLEAARLAGVRRIVFASSSSVYGDQNGMPLHEGMCPNPQSPYALHKLIGEMCCRMYGDLYGMKTVCLRYFNVYGSRFDPTGEYALVIGKFLTQRMRGEPLTITGDGEQTRDFTHVSDVVRASVLAMESDLASRIEVVNVGAGRPVSINRLAELVGGPTIYVPARQEPRHTKAINVMAQFLLCWKPLISIEVGITYLKRELGIE